MQLSFLQGYFYPHSSISPKVVSVLGSLQSPWGKDWIGFQELFFFFSVQPNFIQTSESLLEYSKKYHIISVSPTRPSGPGQSLSRHVRLCVCMCVIKGVIVCREGLRLLPLVTCGRWHVTGGRWHVTCDSWHIKHDFCLTKSATKVQKKSQKVQKSAEKCQKGGIS